MKTKFTSLTWAICFIISIFLYSQSFGQISGRVYWDINNSGSQSSVSNFPHEKGHHGIKVKVYNNSNALIATVFTNSSGDYSIPTVTTFPVRLEFETPSDVVSARPESANNSEVQFISAPTTNANLGIISQAHYVQTPATYAASTAYSNGNALGTGTDEAGLRQNLMVFPYNLDNTWKTGTNYQNRWLGSVFGLTWQKETRTLLMAAYLKRHASFGPGGIDAIYKTTLSATWDASQPTVLCNLSALGINVGSNPRSSTLPNNPGTPNSDPGVFGQVGKRGIGNIDLSDDGRNLFVTNLFENKVHRINIGIPIKTTLTAADVTGTWSVPGPGLAGTEWHIMSVKYYQGLVYVGGVSSKQRTDAPVATQADLDADHVNLRAYVYSIDPATGIITEVLQVPLNYRRGNVINQYRFEFKTNWWRAWQNNGDADVIRNDFNDGMEVFPQPSAPYNTTANTGLIYPQPMLSDIEFDTDGAMVIALRDRFGDQGGLNNFMEGPNGNVSTSGGQYFRVFACGDLLRAGRNGSTWTIENNGSVNNSGLVTDANAGSIQGTPPAGANTFSGGYNPTSGSPWGWSATNGFGPGGRYYYYNQAFDGTGVPISNIQDGTFSGSSVHYTKSYGGIAINPATDEIIQTALSPEGRTFTSGVLKMSNHGYQAGTNAGNMTDQQELVPGTSVASPSATSDPGAFGKANGIGDVEILYEALPIEIGNRIWNDTNNNGRQDPNEPGIANVSVTLRSPGVDEIFGNADDQTWSVISDASGHYYFNSSMVNDNRKTHLSYNGLTGNSGILNNQNYRVEIDMTQPGLSAYIPALANVANENIDNDGTFGNLPGIGNRLYADVNTGTNNFNFDFGVKTGVLPANKLTLKATLAGNNASLHWQTESENNTNLFVIEKGTGNNFTPIADKPAAGNTQAVSNYYLNYDIAIEPAGAILFRIKLIDKDGSYSYSNIVSVKKYSKVDMQVIPNPVSDNFNLSIYTEQPAVVVVKIFNSQGSLVYQKENVKLVKGNNQLPFNDSGNLPAGSYMIRVEGIKGNNFTRRIVKE